MSVVDPLIYKAVYRLKNGYNNWNGGFLDTSTSGCDASLRAKGDNLFVVSTANYGRGVDYRDTGKGFLWQIIQARQPQEPGETVKSGDIVYLFCPAAGYLETRGSGCQDNLLCVSCSTRRDREEGTGRWKILLAEDGELGQEIPLGRSVHLLNGWNNWAGGYLDTRGRGQGTNITGTIPNLLCVSTHAEWNGIDDANTTAWRAEYN